MPEEFHCGNWSPEGPVSDIYGILLVFVGTELAGCFNNNNININNDNPHSPHSLCFVNLSWEWDANWACTRWKRSYKHLRCNTEFPEFTVLNCFCFRLHPHFPASCAIFVSFYPQTPTNILTSDYCYLFGINIPQMFFFYFLFLLTLKGFVHVVWRMQQQDIIHSSHTPHG